MDRRIWKARLMPNMRDEYVCRHDEIWPEMIDELRAAGIRNYTIWNNGDELIGYYECDDLAACEAYKAQSEVMRRWSVSMQGIMEMETDPETGSVKTFDQVFKLM